MNSSANVSLQPAQDDEFVRISSRIESAKDLGPLKIAVCAALAVMNQRIQGVSAKVECLEKAEEERREKKKEKKKFSKADIGGRVIYAFPSIDQTIL